MSHTTRQFVAIILAIWLPLLSGNALAVSVVMQLRGGDCPSAAAQQDAPHCESAIQHTQPDTDPSAGGECGTCHLACCSYLAASSIEVRGETLSVLLFLPVSTRFQSVTPAPLDPPPLASL